MAFKLLKNNVTLIDPLKQGGKTHNFYVGDSVPASLVERVRKKGGVVEEVETHPSVEGRNVKPLFEKKTRKKSKKSKGKD